MSEVQGSVAAQNAEAAPQSTSAKSEVGGSPPEEDDDDVATIFDINEQVSYLVAQGHSGMRINDRGVAPYRVLRHLPRCLGHPAVTRELSMIWDRAVGQYPMSVHLDYYRNNQVAQVIRRFSVLIPGSNFDMFTGLPIDKWLSAIPKTEVGHCMTGSSPCRSTGYDSYAEGKVGNDSTGDLLLNGSRY